MIDFDEIDDWAPKLSQLMASIVDASTINALTNAAPEYLEDAEAQLLASAARDAIIDAMLGWISASTIAMYHGTRVTDEEKSSIECHGLRPLSAVSRCHRLTRTLSRHPDWPTSSSKLEAALLKFGAGSGAGSRENQVHLTLSRAGLVSGFSHYLTHGSEFDQHVAHALLGQQGVDLLGQEGSATIVRLLVPGPRVLEGAHPHLGVDDLRRRGDVPNVVREFLQVWAYRLSHPAFQSRTCKIDCGAVLRETIPPSWIDSIECISP